MIKLQDFANNSLNESEEDFDLIFDEFVNELESDEDKEKAANMKETWKHAWKKHAGNVGHAARGFLHKMWDEDHTTQN